MTGDDLSRIYALTLYYRHFVLTFFRIMLYKSLGASFYAEKSDFQAAGEGCIGASAAPPNAMQG